MTPVTTSVMTPVQDGQLQAGQVPANLRLAQPDESLPGGSRAMRPLDVAECAICGFTHPLGLMVPDGGAACADVLWYCKDVRSCTERWIRARAEAVHAEGTRVGAATGQADGPLADVHPLSAAS